MVLFQTSVLKSHLAQLDESVLVSKMDMYDDVRHLLIQIRKDVEKSQDDGKIYHINALLRDMENTYIN
ncbi:hypothetical protein CXF67_01060 [Psychroflexus sp. MES1-P1E]|nr:hypothetical protein CXF67_01060 [Psychroflexus sp. MES1-P1E]